ncbi:hypothetical protein PACTADRAFT_50310 [Pachysolen tannophilus NRRL Y-2460]|uniref:Palmitoyltransferase n=1 Tax=Pachysolen tannophilus NRRL Y-2460 TaxID=669874 RepID=A0A1E4TV02_PACTA|nr:hypothetical protein PACTADRAFT_50310 [Pachysolen tannophilus NRRL Y-2460]
MNCVGYENTPHFLRFLFWVEITSSFVLYELGKKLILIVKNSNLPAYLFNITELIFVIILVLLDFMMFATITILLIRVLYGIGFSGMTQIEIWERERLESQFFTKRLWRQISKNYYQQYGKFLDLSKLTTWTNTGTNSLKTSGHYLTENLAENHILGNDVDVDINDDDEEKDETETGIEMRNLKTTDIDNIEPPQNFTIDDIIFPYDISFYQNLTNSLGPWYLWLYPWSKAPHTPTNNGLIFEIEGNFAEDDQLGLPWPPDGGNQNVCATGTDENIAFTRSITDKNSLKKKIKFVDPRLSLKRTEWYNEFGEGLGDFGVDVDAEDDYDDTSVNKKYAEQEDGVGNSTGN